MAIRPSPARTVIYQMTVSLDGFIEGPDQDLSWHIVNEEFHTFVNDLQREVDTYLFGRRMFDVMRVWDTVDEDTEMSDFEHEFARIWREKTKIVFSRTLDSVPETYTLATDGVAETLAELKRQPGGQIEVAGPGLAASLMDEHLIDEYRLFVPPFVLGGGTPCFPPGTCLTGLQLVESRAFDSGVVYLRYRDNASACPRPSSSSGLTGE